MRTTLGLGLLLTVGLLRSVPLLSDKRRIEHDVLSTDGTQSVDNRLTVSP